MDIVLECFDTYALDYLYASLLPAQTPVYNATRGSVPAQAAPAWKFEPASAYLSFTPGPNAYLSQWNRDDWRRQLLSLYTITW